MEPTWGPSGPTGPGRAPCWPHEICYLGPDSQTAQGISSNTGRQEYMISKIFQHTKPDIHTQI